MKRWLFLLSLFIYLNALGYAEQTIEDKKLSQNDPADIIPFSPLFDLEPPLSLYVNHQNQQELLSANRLLAEKKYNIKYIEEHTFPWGSLLILGTLGIGMLIIAQLKPHLITSFLKKPEKSLQTQAQEQLNDLKKAKDRSPDLKDAYLKVADFHTWYLSNYYKRKISITALTEIKPFLENLNIPVELKKQLNSYWEEVFYVKFAHHSLSSSQYENALKIAQKLINDLKS